MPQHYAGDRLGPLDSLFLYLEKKEMPLHIGSVFTFDGRLPVDDLKSLIESKLPLIPRYRQRVDFPPLNAGYPTWEFDPAFNIDRHILSARIRPGTKEELENLAGEIFSQIMDRNRPLWDLTVVDGLRGGRSALIARVHHCLVDGVAGVGLMNLILDHTPEPSGRLRRTRFRAPQPPTPDASLLDAMLSSYSHTAGRLFSMQSAALDVTQALLGELAQGSLAPPVKAVAELVKPAQGFPFRAPCSGPRRVSWTEFAMADIDAIREPLGAKVNDAGVAILGAAMRRYAQAHRLPLKNRVLRLMMPVNLRRLDQSNGLGNKISLVPMNVPLDIADPRELLRAIHERSDALKHARAANLVVLGGALLALMPVPLQAAFTGILSNTVSVLPFDMVCTNVPGPPEPLYLLGRKMLTYYPYVPIGDFMGVCCAMVSYNGTLYFGLTGDSAWAADLGRLRDFLDDAFLQFKRAIAKPPAPRRVRRERQPIRPASPAVTPAEPAAAK
ncbi:MAG TPA: wax ester/triacylglycerol synthase family O-acyltransferase [Bryobacteraceae bacterium]|nr:wax ester/triacylglycerol synthase family O-acyltransferase [Bryobacteraceae bacterium]